MDYNALVRDLLVLDQNDVQGMQRLTRLMSDLSDPSTKTLLDNLKVFENLITSIGSLNNTSIIPPDTLTHHDRFLNRMERLSACEALTIPSKARTGVVALEPYFSKFDMIYVNFGGVGWEYDSPHFALVWEDNDNDSEITVIPTTSQFTKNYATEFSIGAISGLPAKNTILSITKMMRISRKRVILHKGRYLQGAINKRSQKDLQKRIEQALGIWLHNINTLEYYVKNETGSALPIDFMTHYPGMRFLPVVDVNWKAVDLELHYRIWNETPMNVLRMKNPTTFVDKGYKIHRIYDWLFSNDVPNIRAAHADFQNLY
jgi:hypothetical protein